VCERRVVSRLEFSACSERGGGASLGLVNPREKRIARILQ